MICRPGVESEYKLRHPLTRNSSRVYKQSIAKRIRETRHGGQEHKNELGVTAQRLAGSSEVASDAELAPRFDQQEHPRTKTTLEETQSREGPAMSGDGVVTVRLPLTLLGALRAAAQDQGISIHEAARRAIEAMAST